MYFRELFATAVQRHAVPILVKLIMSPLVLIALAIVGTPSFLVLVILSPTIPFRPSLVNVNIDFADWGCILKYHLLLPTITMRDIYLARTEERMKTRGKCARYALLPLFSLGCFILAVAALVFLMPAVFLYEALLRNITVGLQEGQEKPTEAQSAQGNVAQAHAESTESRVVLHPDLSKNLHQKFLSNSRLDLQIEESECRDLMGDEEEDKSDKTTSVSAIPNELRASVLQFFMLDLSRLDLGMLWSIGIRGGVLEATAAGSGHGPILTSLQLERIFASSYGHELRVERALRKVMNKVKVSGSFAHG